MLLLPKTTRSIHVHPTCSRSMGGGTRYLTLALALDLGLGLAFPKSKSILILLDLVSPRNLCLKFLVCELESNVAALFNRPATLDSSLVSRLDTTTLLMY